MVGSNKTWFNTSSTGLYKKTPNRSVKLSFIIVCKIQRSVKFRLKALLSFIAPILKKIYYGLQGGPNLLIFNIDLHLDTRDLLPALIL